LGAIDFPFNELQPQIRHLALLATTAPDTDPTGWQLRFGVPGHPDTIAASPNAEGEIAVTASHPWQPLLGGPALGEYLVEIRPEENPGLVEDGKLKLDAIRNLVLIVEYAYTPRV
jgi:hypothetical protein